MRAEQPWHILLLGGAAAAGKSTCARSIAHAQSIDAIDADTLWLAVGAATTPTTHPAFHRFRTEESAEVPDAETLTRWHIDAAQAMSAPLAAVIAHQCELDHPPAVIEGAWITPEFAARVSAEGESAGRSIRAVIIFEQDRDALVEVMRSRRYLEQATPRQLAIEEMSWVYGNWLAAQAKDAGIRVVEARPRDSLVSRVLSAAVQQ